MLIYLEQSPISFLKRSGCVCVLLMYFLITVGWFPIEMRQTARSGLPCNGFQVSKLWYDLGKKEAVWEQLDPRSHSHRWQMSCESFNAGWKDLRTDIWARGSDGLCSWLIVADWSTGQGYYGWEVGFTRVSSLMIIFLSCELGSLLDWMLHSPCS